MWIAVGLVGRPCGVKRKRNELLDGLLRSLHNLVSLLIATHCKRSATQAVPETVLRRLMPSGAARFFNNQQPISVGVCARAPCLVAFGLLGGFGACSGLEENQTFTR